VTATHASNAEVETSEAGSPAQQRSVSAVTAIDADVWFALSNWAKQTNSLLPWQRGLAYSIGRLNSNGRTASIKQAKQGSIILVEAVRLGFRHDGLAQHAVAEVAESLTAL
jgi:hypothetical protein